jgi:hypothetical protein
LTIVFRAWLLTAAAAVKEIQVNEFPHQDGPFVLRGFPEVILDSRWGAGPPVLFEAIAEPSQPGGDSSRG